MWNQLIRDPIFQLSSVIFIAASFIGVWLVYSSVKNKTPKEPLKKENPPGPASVMPDLSEDARYHMLLENIKNILARLDSIEVVLKSHQGRSSSLELSAENIKKIEDLAKSSVDIADISKKLDAIYKVLGGLSGDK